MAIFFLKFYTENMWFKKKTRNSRSKNCKRWNLRNNIPLLLLIGVADKPTDNKSGRIMGMVLDKPILI